MTYIPQQRIEELAWNLWAQHDLAPGFDIERLLDQLGLDLLWEPIADQNDGVVLGQLVPDENLVILNERQRNRLEANGGRQRRYTIGHEVGHWTLHSTAVRSGTLNLFDGKRILCRDRSTHPAERHAEKFAAALLMPNPQLLKVLMTPPWHGWRPVYGLADRFVVTPTAMAIRLEELGLMHREEDGEPVSGPAVVVGQAPLFP